MERSSSRPPRQTPKAQWTRLASGTWSRLGLKQAHRKAPMNGRLAINNRTRRYLRESLASDIPARLFLLQTHLRLRNHPDQYRGLLRPGLEPAANTAKVDGRHRRRGERQVARDSTP